MLSHLGRPAADASWSSGNSSMLAHGGGPASLITNINVYVFLIYQKLYGDVPFFLVLTCQTALVSA